MKLSIPEIYIIIVNLIGFISCFINIIIYKLTSYRKFDSLLMIISFLGGSLGILPLVLLLDRKNRKENIMFHVFVVCMFIIQLTTFLILKVNLNKKISFAIWKLFFKYKILFTYLILINLITFIIFWIDKIKAKTGRWRYKIITLLGFCFIGGSIGGLLSMYVFHHKTKVNYFTLGIPIMIIMQILLILFLTNLI